MRILALKFLLRSDGLSFPEFSGSIWHGGIGKILALQAPEAFRCLYQTTQESRLYSLLPTYAANIPQGKQFELGVTLFGAGVNHALAIVQAIADLGKMGLRPGGQFSLVKAHTESPSGFLLIMSEDEGFLALPQAHTTEDYFVAAAELTQGCEVRFTTPLRIKEGNNLLRSAPSYAQLIQRILGRNDQLAHASQEPAPIPKSQRDNLYEEAIRIQIASTNIHLDGITRRSARSEQQMQFNGIVGSVAYQGHLQQTLPWLRLAEIIQLGGKTAFGFGGIRIEANN